VIASFCKIFSIIHFIMHQHVMHAERDIMLCHLFPSVCSCVQCRVLLLNKWTKCQTFLPVCWGHHSVFSRPIAITKFQGCSRMMRSCDIISINHIHDTHWQYQLFYYAYDCAIFVPEITICLHIFSLFTSCFVYVQTFDYG